VIQKFNDAKGWNCQTIEELHNCIHIGIAGQARNDAPIADANKIFNSIHICDSAVGSGHFLVSALNELIYLKAQLGILADKNEKLLWNYNVSIENDELIVRNPDGDIFIYHPQNIESQRVQETFFHEKQTLIENCLFGVDINPNSVKICQLRLWIELLKHAYYTTPSAFGVHPSINGGEFTTPQRGGLQTLPNIDINIKCGNSLLSRFDLTDNYNDVQGLKKKVIQATKNYKAYVALYKTCINKKEKSQISKNIENEKNIFYQINYAKDSDYLNLKNAENELSLHIISYNFYTADADQWNEVMEVLTEKVNKFKTIYNDKIRGCFEWRFEFPEVLDDDGNFTGFDVIIGNPPYISAPTMVNIHPEVRKSILESKNYTALHQKWDVYIPFIERGLQLLVPNGIFSMIVPYPLTTEKYAKKLRELILKQHHLIEIADLRGSKVFVMATVSNCIPIIIKSQTGTKCYVSHIDEKKQICRSFL
jgi:hypothetical protein